MSKKLYRVNVNMCRHFTDVFYNEAYVIAENAEEAYTKFRKYLDDNDVGFDRERRLSAIELLAEDSGVEVNRESGMLLFL